MSVEPVKIETTRTIARESSIEKLEHMLKRAREHGLDWVVIVAGTGPDYLFSNSFCPDYLVTLGALERARHLVHRQFDKDLE